MTLFNRQKKSKPCPPKPGKPEKPKKERKRIASKSVNKICPPKLGAAPKPEKTRPRIAQKRRKPRNWKGNRVRLGPEGMAELRAKKYADSGGQCEDCKIPVPPDNWELAHGKVGGGGHGRGAGGDDTEENTWVSCKFRLDGLPGCHAKSHNAGGKPCPEKPKPEEDADGG